MDKRELNRRINGLKDAYPEQLTLIEGIQDLMNKKIEVISKKNRMALRQFPMQFTRRIPLGSGEWTTTLHMWADNLVDTLLEIDPLVLTCTDSSGYTVLHALVFAATGKFTQRVDYDFIRKLLNKNMSYIEMVMPNDINSKQEGNAWVIKDIMQKTPMDYLVEFANGDDGNPPDEQLQQLLYEFGNSPVTETPVDNTPDMPVSDQELQMAAEQTMQPGAATDDPAAQQAPQQDTPDLSKAQEMQDENDAIHASEKDVQGVTAAAQAGAQEKHTEKNTAPLCEDRKESFTESALGILGRMV